MPRRRLNPHTPDGLPPPLTPAMLERRLKVLREWLKTERAAVEFQDFVEPRRLKAKVRRSRALENAYADMHKRTEQRLISTLRIT